MSQKSSPESVIYPDVLYTTESAARALGVTPRWLRENLILTGEVSYAPLGRGQAIPGFCLIEWAHRSLQQCDTPKTK